MCLFLWLLNGSVLSNSSHVTDSNKKSPANANGTCNNDACLKAQ